MREIDSLINRGIFPKDMGRELNRAFEKRQIGDYEYTSVISNEDARQLLDSGNQFVDAIDCRLESSNGQA